MVEGALVDRLEVPSVELLEVEELAYMLKAILEELRAEGEAELESQAEGEEELELQA